MRQQEGLALLKTSHDSNVLCVSEEVQEVIECSPDGTFPGPTCTVSTGTKFGLRIFGTGASSLTYGQGAPPPAENLAPAGGMARSAPAPWGPPVA